MTDDKSKLPPVVWSKRGDVYSEEEAEAKHALANKETIMVSNEVVRQMKEKERIEKAMANINDKMQMEIEPVPSHWIAQVKFDKEIVDLINDYIDETADDGYSYADRLVGQLKNDERSSQVSFDLESEQGKEIEVILNGIGSAYLQQAYKRKSIAQVVDIWTNHAYAGDYNPLHDHNAATQGGLSGFLWLKTPDSLKVEHKDGYMNGASGVSDGTTQLIWGLRQRQDIDALYCSTEKYYVPEEGVMLVFPNWMKHQVMPFYGEGERRSLAMNWAIVDSHHQLIDNMTPSEVASYHENIEAQKIQRLENGTSAEEPYNVIVGGQLRYVRTDIFTSGDA